LATDATGTPTSPDNIPTFNVDVDAPSGLGSNAQMAAIQAALSARINTPAGIVTGEIPVWNGSTWVRSSALGMAPSGISGYPSDPLKVLKGDGSWTKRGMALLWDSVDAAVSLPVATIVSASLDQGFRHLRVVMTGKVNGAVSSANALMQLNGVSTTTYDYIFNTNSNGVNTAGSGAAQTSALIGTVPGTTNAAALGTTVVDIAQYTLADGTHTAAWTFNSFNAGAYTAATMQSVTGGGSWNTLGAISTISFISGSGSWAAPTRISIYGVGL